MMRRPMWLGAGIALGVGGTLWAEQRVRRRLRRAVELVSPAVAGSEALRAGRDVAARLREAADAARVERRRHEAELRRRMGIVSPSVGRSGEARRQHR